MGRALPAGMERLGEKSAELSHDQYVALLEVTESIASHRNLADLFQDLTRRLHSLLNFKYLSLVLPDPEQNVMRLRTLEATENGALKPGMEFPMEGSLSAEVWKRQCPVVIADSLPENRFARAGLPSAQHASQETGDADDWRGRTEYLWCGPSGNPHPGSRASGDCGGKC